MLQQTVLASFLTDIRLQQARVIRVDWRVHIPINWRKDFVMKAHLSDLASCQLYLRTRTFLFTMVLTPILLFPHIVNISRRQTRKNHHASRSVLVLMGRRWSVRPWGDLLMMRESGTLLHIG